MKYESSMLLAFAETALRLAGPVLRIKDQRVEVNADNG
jgi:hypothetical protein